MNDTVPIVVNVPQGDYCAKFTENSTNLELGTRCPILQRCGAHSEAYFCPIANYDTHCGIDKVGVLKQRDYFDSICPSLYQTRIMELLRGTKA